MSALSDYLIGLTRDARFRERKRGYDFGEVDEYVRTVNQAAIRAIDQIADLEERFRRMESGRERERDKGADETRETLLKTLTMAQRAADTTLAEARSEAKSITDAAVERATKTVSQAEAAANDRLRFAEEKATQTLADGEENCRLIIAEAKRTAAAEVAAERERWLEELQGLREVKTGLESTSAKIRARLDDERAQMHSLMASFQAFINEIAPQAAGLTSAGSRPSDLTPEPAPAGSPATTGEPAGEAEEAQSEQAEPPAHMRAEPPTPAAAGGRAAAGEDFATRAPTEPPTPTEAGGRAAAGEDFATRAPAEAPARATLPTPAEAPARAAPAEPGGRGPHVGGPHVERAAMEGDLGTPVPARTEPAAGRDQRPEPRGDFGAPVPARTEPPTPAEPGGRGPHVGGPHVERAAMEGDLGTRVPTENRVPAEAPARAEAHVEHRANTGAPAGHRVAAGHRGPADAPLASPPRAGGPEARAMHGAAEQAESGHGREVSAEYPANGEELHQEPTLSIGAVGGIWADNPSQEPAPLLSPLSEDAHSDQMDEVPVVKWLDDPPTSNMPTIKPPAEAGPMADPSTPAADDRPRAPGFEPVERHSEAFVPAAPHSQPAAVEELPPLFDTDADDDDEFIEQLRRVVSSDAPLPDSEAAMSAFFNHDENASRGGGRGAVHRRMEGPGGGRFGWRAQRP